MPVFDFSNTPDSDKEVVCTYTTFHSNERIATPDKPILVLDNRERKWNHYSSGMFTNPIKETTFEFNEEDGKHKADILQIDSRFVARARISAGYSAVSGAGAAALTSEASTASSVIS